MKSPQLPAPVIVYRPRSNGQPQKSQHLSLDKVTELIAHAAVMTKDDLVEASKSQIYVTDRDEFVDLSAHQSVNTNPSTNTGVRS